MKYRNISVAAALLLMISATGCAGNLANNASRLNNNRGPIIERNHNNNTHNTNRNYGNMNNNQRNHNFGNSISNNINRASNNNGYNHYNINRNLDNRNNYTNFDSRELSNGYSQNYTNEMINNNLGEILNTNNPSTSGSYIHPNAINNTVYNENGNTNPELVQNNRTMENNNDVRDRATRRRRNATIPNRSQNNNQIPANRSTGQRGTPMQNNINNTR